MEPFCVLPMLAWVSSGQSGFLATVQRHSYSKLPIGMPIGFSFPYDLGVIKINGCIDKFKYSNEIIQWLHGQSMHIRSKPMSFKITRGNCSKGSSNKIFQLLFQYGDRHLIRKYCQDIRTFLFDFLPFSFGAICALSRVKLKWTWVFTNWNCQTNLSRAERHFSILKNLNSLYLCWMMQWKALRLIDPVYFYRHVYSACFAVHRTKLPLE